MRTRAVVWILLAAGTQGAAVAQPVFKCLEGRSVTYSSSPCDELGLKPGGEIKDRVTTVPAVRRPAASGKPEEGGAKARAASADNGVDVPRPAAIKPVNPLVEKLLK